MPALAVAGWGGRGFLTEAMVVFVARLAVDVSRAHALLQMYFFLLFPNHSYQPVNGATWNKKQSFTHEKHNAIDSQ